MSTITREERSEWRHKHTAEPYNYGHRIIRLLDVLDAAEALNAALRRLVDAHDNYLCTVDKTSTISPQFIRLEEARAKVAALEAAKSDPAHECRTCADWGGEEVGCDTGCYGTCTTRDPEEGTTDHWRPCNFERRCETCAHHGADYPDDCDPCRDAEDLPNWKPAHPAFAPAEGGA